jgi:hypothetical protein
MPARASLSFLAVTTTVSIDRGNRERRKENRHRRRGDVMTGVEDFLTDRAIGGIVARRIFVVIVLVFRGTQRLDGL